MNKIVVISDIHANLSALNAVVNDIHKHYHPEGIALLGDVINYGMRPNEVIEVINNFDIPIICNLMGNHEKAILCNQSEHFSSDRGRASLEYTKDILNSHSLHYIQNNMASEGKLDMFLNGKKILFIHGDIDDSYWGKLSVEKTRDSRYSIYDYVISGHTHMPHYVETFFPDNNPAMRDKKKTIFLNPGSVGQPRNHNSLAQYLYLDISSQIVHHNAVPYDIAKEQELYPNSIDIFYRDRLLTGV